MQSANLTRLAKLLTRHTLDGKEPLVKITNATFYKTQPRDTSTTAESLRLAPDSSENQLHDSNPPLFPDLTFSLPSTEPDEVWSIISPSSITRTTFLQILCGQHLCFPPTARSYPYFSAKGIYPGHAVQYVGFDSKRGGLGSAAMRGGYLAARYESRREATDFSLLDYLAGKSELNPDEKLVKYASKQLLKSTMKALELEGLAEMPVNQLSNGQSRRARIAKALLQRPGLLLLDGPFIGLDPSTVNKVSTLVGALSRQRAPYVFLGLRPEEHVPAWVSHVLLAGSRYDVEMAGPKEEVLEYAMQKRTQLIRSLNISSTDLTFVDSSRRMHQGKRLSVVMARRLRKVIDTAERLDNKHSRSKQSYIRGHFYSRDGFLGRDEETATPGEEVLDIKGAKVVYGEKTVLGGWKQSVGMEEKEGLWWTVCRGQRWGVFGPNGSGKTTLLSLITSDHPQTYSQPVRLFGRSRLPEPGQPGVSIFELQQRIGHSSPEVHAFFPRNLSVRRTLESAWADTPLTKPRLDYIIDEKIDAALRWFQGELNPSLGTVPWLHKEMIMKGADANPSYNRLATDVSKLSLREALAAIEDEDVDANRLNWADEMKFGELSFSAQRVALFLRAILKAPDIVILDEAFSGMDDFARDRCLLFLSHGESMVFRFHGQGGTKLRSLRPRASESMLSRLDKVKVPGLSKEQALIVVSHRREDVPGCVREWLRLPLTGEGPPKMGRMNGPLELQLDVWEKDIWSQKRYRSVFRAKKKPGKVIAEA